MPGELNGKRVIVTGGSGGIGLGIVLEAAQAGADIAFCSRSDASAVVRQVEALGRRCLHTAVDVSDLAAARAFVNASVRFLGGLDGLVNNAGADFNHGVAGTSLAQIQQCLATNFLSAWAISQEAYPALRQAGRGAVVNISSVHGHQTVPGAFPYNAAKAAMDAMTISMAQEWAADNILAVSVSPGWVRTPMVERDFARHGDAEAQLRQLASRHLLGRIGTPTDIAALTVFLLSDRNQFLTGSVIIQDGGQHTLFAPH
ncbi:MAG: SDR family oxidoreductase [Planctomycetota bacterium]